MVWARERVVRRRHIALAGAALVIAAAIVAIVLTRDKEDLPQTPVERANPVLDLLGWIPATDETRRTFAVWSEDVGGADGTPVATSYADSAAAGKALDTYTAGWEGGIVITTQAGVEIGDLGSVNAVGQTDEWLIAELVDGREDGWVRAGVRFANPVCEAAATALPRGTPVALSNERNAHGPRESPEGGST